MKIPDTRYAAYIDETGDYGLNAIDPNMPVFATCALTLSIEDYTEIAVPLLCRLKYEFFGSESVVLHGHKIRQRSAEFALLKNAEIRDRFMQAVAQSFGALPDNCLICAAIKKEDHKKQYAYPGDPFDLSLCFLLERLHRKWAFCVSPSRRLLCVFEKRGPEEDGRIREKFERICAGANYEKTKFHFDIDFRSKHENIIGHQFADLAAYSIARYVETGNDDRRDWQAVKAKIRKSGAGKVVGYGLKVFP